MYLVGALHVLSGLAATRLAGADACTCAHGQLCRRTSQPDFDLQQRRQQRAKANHGGKERCVKCVVGVERLVGQRRQEGQRGQVLLWLTVREGVLHVTALGAGGGGVRLKLRGGIEQLRFGCWGTCNCSGLLS